MSAKPIITDAKEEDCAALAALSAKTFSETFGHLYKPENLAQHLQTHSNENYFRDGIRQGDSVLVMKQGSDLIGYGKIGHLGLPVKSAPKAAQEIQRVYIDAPFQGKGYGRDLMLHMLALPRLATAHHTYLSVWEENLRAQALYRQFGFEPAGKYLYYVGDQADQELIMLRKR